jgi:hypothetical protein
MSSPLHRLYRTKLALLATILIAVGVFLLGVSSWLTHAGTTPLLASLPLTEIGSAIFTTGLLAVGFEYLDRADAEERASQRLRQVLAEQAPAIRDAVVDGFAFSPAALTRVSSSETLDKIVRNCLAIRLRDASFASELYADIDQQLITMTERHYDMRVSVSLAPWTDGPDRGHGSMFVATVRREYRVRLDRPTFRFSCVSSIEEYRELLRDPTTAEVWYFEPIAGLDGSSPAVFELLQFAVNGKSRAVRRTKRAGMQVFTGDAGAAADQPVHVAYTYKVLVQRNGHLLFLDFRRPCRGVEVELRYGACGIRYVNAVDFIASSQQPRILRSSVASDQAAISIGFDGWVMPKSGVSFVWVLDKELIET